jgi:hypothetical protein
MTAWSHAIACNYWGFVSGYDQNDRFLVTGKRTIPREKQQNSTVQDFYFDSGHEEALQNTGNTRLRLTVMTGSAGPVSSSRYPSPPVTPYDSLGRRGRTSMNEIIFLIVDAPEGGYCARALGTSIFTEAETLDDLRRNIREAVDCHFEGADGPGRNELLVRLFG